MASMTGNALAAQALRAEGAEVIFYLAGGPMFDVMWEAMRLGVRAIHTRHEQGAAMMAHGYARASGKVGLVNTSSGPGTINASTGMINASLDAVPIILLAGASPLRTRDLEDFQEVDQVGAMRPLSKWAVQVHEVRRIPEYIAAAYRKALGNRPGPVHLDFPGDVLYGEVEEQNVVWGRSVRPTPAAADPDAVREAVKMLKAAARPLVITGSGVLWSEASQALEAFVERTHIPFFTTPQGRGVVPDDHPLAFANARSTAFREADVLLVVGTRFNVILGFGRSPRFAPDATVIMLNTDVEELGKGRPIHLGIAADARQGLTQLVAEAERAGDWPAETRWISHLRDVDRRKGKEMEPLLTSEQTPIHPLRLCHELRRFMERDAILCVDGHDTLNFARQSIPTFVPGHRINAGPNGCMGVAVPNAIGAQAAKPDKQVIALTGDGSFGMNGFEIETAVREKLPVITVICNNGGWTANHPPKPGRDLPFTGYERIAEVLGGYGERVERPGDIRGALDRAAKSGVPACVNVICDPAAKSETARFSSYFQQQS
ncbi:MAG: thiamine pyrophosphate-binding protein [Actinobacteria bacterium]|nr:thiamine pyrophosphate-binding protein [Actinomycetota bacterium]